MSKIVKSDSSVSEAAVMCTQRVFLMMCFSVEEKDLCLPEGEFFCLNIEYILSTTNGIFFLLSFFFRS